MKGQDKGKKKYIVTFFPEVSVKVVVVEASSQTGAITAAYDQVDWQGLFAQSPLLRGVQEIAFQDGFSCARVDEEGDEGFERTRWYGADGESLLPSEGPAALAGLLLECLEERARLYSDLSRRIETALGVPYRCSQPWATYKIYYAREGAANMPPDDGPLPALDQTHALVAEIGAASISQAFRRMQGERWSPDGQARVLLKAQGVHPNHVSITTGDVIEAPDGKFYWVVGNAVFQERVQR